MKLLKTLVLTLAWLSLAELPGLADARCLRPESEILIPSQRHSLCYSEAGTPDDANDDFAYMTVSAETTLLEFSYGANTRGNQVTVGIGIAHLTEPDMAYTLLSVKDGEVESISGDPNLIQAYAETLQEFVRMAAPAFERRQGFPISSDL